MIVRLPENFDLIAAAPAGIRKLRGLILELAVRGKLVPQDPNDEPASELLKRIAVERARLEGVATRKKNKQTPLSEDDNWPFAIPNGWEWSRLSDLTQVLNGRAYSKDELLDSGTPVLRVGNLFTSNQWYYSSLTLEPQKYCEAGDLIYSWSASFGPFIWNGPKVIYHYHIWKLALFDETSYSKTFLYKFLLEKTAEIKAAGHGVSMIHMTKEKMEKLPVPVPPLAEQHPIVAKVDELMALCDRLEAEQADAETAHARLVATLLGTLTQSVDAAELAANWQRLAEHFVNLFTTEASLDALKQTILQLAVMGKLVPQDPNDEPASELLKRIARERARLEAEGVCKKSKATPPVGEDAQPFTVPDGWMWVRIDDVSQLVTDGEHATPTRTSDRSAIPLVTAKNVRDGYLDYTHTDFVPKDVAEKCWKRCKPTLGDILLVSVGATLGRLSVLDHDRDMVLVRSVTVIRPCLVDRSFFATALRSPIVQDSIWRGVKQSAQPCLYLAQSSSLAIPLPPLAEQHRIVAKVNELLTLCDRLKADLADSRARQERLAATLIESALQAA